MFGSSSGSPFGSNTAGNAGSQPAGAQSGFSLGNNTNRAASFLFGSQQPQAGGFGQNNTTNQPPLFGTGSTGQTQQGSGGGLFGQNNQNTQIPGQNQSGGLFGQNNNQSGTTGGLFGLSGTLNTNSGGLFGSKPTQNATSGGLFGSSQNTTQSNATGGLFGQGGNQNSTQNSTSGGLFGNSQNTGQNNTSGGGLFGQGNNQNSTQNASAGLFGLNNNQNTQNNTSGGLFGGSNTSTNTGGGLFGGNKPPAPSGGLFGQSNTANAANSTTGNTSSLFGQQNAAPNNSLFGQTTQNQNQPQNQNSNQPSFNNSQPSFGWNSQKPAAPAIQSIVPARSEPTKTNYTPPISDQLLKIKEKWDPLSPKLALKSHFYNKVNDGELAALLNQLRPQNESPEDWDAAMSNRPSASFYPIKVTSFTDVAQRVEIQLEHVAKSRVVLNEILEKQSALSSKHDLDNSTRILRAKNKHAKLLRRLLRVATILAVLKLKGYPLSPEEEELSKQFDLLNGAISDPNLPLGHLSDIFARVTILKERSDELNRQFDTTVRSMSSKEDEVNGDKIVQKVSQLLLKQQVGLNHLNKVIAEDMEKVLRK